MLLSVGIGIAVGRALGEIHLDAWDPPGEDSLEPEKQNSTQWLRSWMFEPAQESTSQQRSSGAESVEGLAVAWKQVFVVVRPGKVVASSLPSKSKLRTSGCYCYSSLRTTTSRRCPMILGENESHKSVQGKLFEGFFGGVGVVTITIGRWCV